MTIEVPARTAGMLRRPVVAGAVLLLVYAGLSMFMDPNGYLGTDTGAKVATLEMMARNSTVDPDVGYWAADLDPEGVLHPLYQAQPRDDGGWVAVSTLPVLELALPLYALGGYRAALLLPMLGAVATAFAARSIARRVGATDGGWSTFWLLGLASPMVVYAIDFWEHSIGVACMVGSVALLIGVLDGAALVRAAAAGGLLGFGAVLRNETLVYALIAVLTIAIASIARTRSLKRAVMLSSLSAIGFLVPWTMNVLLEKAVGAPTRAARTSGTARGLGSDLDDRAREALQTSLGLNAGDLGESVVLGIVVVGVVLMAIRAEARGDRHFATVGLIGVACVYVVAAAGGLGFIPGLLPAFPMAIAGAARIRDPLVRVVGVIALAALPVVYLVQFTGGAAPQWGGRYTLTSAVLLGTIGVVLLTREFPRVTRGLAALSLVATLLGVGWLAQRSRGVDSFFDDVIAQAEPVVISRNAFLVREGGPVSLDRRWLSVADEAGFSEAIEVARKVGEERFSVLEWGAEAPPQESLPDDVREVSRSPLRFVDVPVGLVTYEFVG